jgi:hypothetical protein
MGDSDPFTLEDSYDAYPRLLQLAQTTGGVYERENVIGDPNQTVLAAKAYTKVAGGGLFVKGLLDLHH